VILGRARKLGADHPETLTSKSFLARIYISQGKGREAELLFREVLDGSRHRLGPDHNITDASVSFLINCYELMRQPDRAEPLSLERAESLKKRAGANSNDYSQELARLGRLLLAQNKYAQAETVVRESLAIRKRDYPEHWLTFNLNSMLGGALVSQQKYAEAEPLLLEGYEGLQERLYRVGATTTPERGYAPPANLAETLEWLVQLYDGWDKKEQADEWRKKLEAQKK
jgi:hypothetical protein